MVGICFYFEDNDTDVWSGRRIDLDAWNYAAKAAGDIDEMIVINRTNNTLTTPDGNMAFQVVDEPPTLSGHIAHICCPWDKMREAVPLWKFDHKVDWYVFGPANGWQHEVDVGVYVPQAGQAALHSTHVASTVMFHRYRTLTWQ